MLLKKVKIGHLIARGLGGDDLAEQVFFFRGP